MTPPIGPRTPLAPARSRAPEPRPAPPEPAAEAPATPPPRRASSVRAGAKQRAAFDPLARYLEQSLRLSATNAQPFGPAAPSSPAAWPKPGAPAPKGGEFTEYAKTSARSALDAEAAPDPKHPYVAHKAEIKDKLGRLGALGKGDARLHVADLDPVHGAQVLRTAAGRTSLAEGAATTLSMQSPAPAGLADKTLTKGQRDRLAVGNALQEKHSGATAGIDDQVKVATARIEGTLIDKQLRMAEIRDALPKPPDGKKTIVNMSWGSSADLEADRISEEMLTAPKGTKAHAEVVATLGREPDQINAGGRVLTKTADRNLLKQKLIYPKLKAAIESKDFRAGVEESRRGIADQALAGRKEGVLFFQAAGNEGGRATRLGDPSMSENFANGIPGVITVGSVDIGQRGLADDKVAEHSAAGKPDLSAPGENIPDGANGGAPLSGTSMASPIAAETAYAMAAANPKLTADEIAKLMKDPRALNDIKGTDRDGDGQIDPFAAVLLAKNPKLTRAQIDHARDALDDPKADVAKIKKALGLP